jgi:hypothetical protein
MTIARARRITSIVASALVWTGLAVWLAACSPAQVAQGQLYCAKTVAGLPMVVALVDLAGAPVIATNAGEAFVNASCALVAGIPVSPPAAPSAAPVVAVAVAAKTGA